VRRSASEKQEIIRLVEHTDLPVRVTLRELGIAPSTFYRWHQRSLEGGFDALHDKKPRRRARWNQIPEPVRAEVVQLALQKTELSARELACHYTDERRYFPSESSVYRILKAHDLITSPAYVLLSASDAFKHPTRRVHEMWRTDYFSRFIIAYRLSPTMAATDVTETLDDALVRGGVQTVRVRHRPRLLSDNGPAYVSKDLQDYLEEHGMEHTRGRPYHPQTQDKIERYHRSMKNVVKLRTIANIERPLFEAYVIEAKQALTALSGARIHQQLADGSEIQTAIDRTSSDLGERNADTVPTGFEL
jgi:transposase InsO family protein